MTFMAKRPTLTTDSGMPVSDNQNSITAGPRGPVLLQDFFLFEKLAHQNRERIPERGQHAKGSGAYGTLTITQDITKYTKAKVLQKGKKTEAFIRFSTVAGERGAADAERDVRGFALRFYTEEGNWDMVGNNTPIFFVRDALKFPDFIHTQKRHPRTNMRSPTAMWDFWSLSPESLHQVTLLMSDRGLPQSYRNIDGFGSHTYSFINAKNERHWVKFHFKTMLTAIRRIISPKSSRPRSRPPISCPALATRRTGCCRRAFSPMLTRTAIASASMRISFPSTGRAVPSTPTTWMAPCGSQAIRILMPITSQTRSTVRCRTSASASRR
jgi:hypothetical protein